MATLRMIKDPSVHVSQKRMRRDDRTNHPTAQRKMPKDGRSLADHDDFFGSHPLDSREPREVHPAHRRRT